MKFDHKIMRMRGDTIATQCLQIKRVAGSIPALELFFSLLFFLSQFFSLSFSFMLAPPFQCSSIFLVIALDHYDVLWLGFFVCVSLCVLYFMST